jgi:hypothetical protein
MEYKIVVKRVTNVVLRDIDKAAEQLVMEVNTLTSMGWEPVCGVAIGDAGTTPYLLQAMIKRR